MSMLFAGSSPHTRSQQQRSQHQLLFIERFSHTPQRLEKRKAAHAETSLPPTLQYFEALRARWELGAWQCALTETIEVPVV